MALETQDGNVTSTSPGSGGGGPITAAVEVQDEGATVASVAKINFVGKDVTVFNSPLFSRVDVDIAREDVFHIDIGKEGKTENMWLKGPGGLYMNVSPANISFDSELYAISVSVDAPSTFSVEIYLNSNIISVPNQADAFYVLQVNSSATAFATGINLGIPANSDVAAYLRGSVRNPIVNLFLRRT